MSLYNKIGLDYDSTRKADPFILERVKNHLNLNDKKKCIDIACGSGNYTIELNNMGLNIYGIDISTLMIDEARKKNSNIKWENMNAEEIAYQNDYFDGAICTMSIHHFESIPLVFNEVYRILKSGRFVIFTSTREQMKNYWLNRYFPKAMEESLNKMPAFDDIVKSLKSAGFLSIKSENYSIRDDLKDLFLYSGKYRPEIYLDPKIRQGISTFANIANKDEVEEGISRLIIDIEDDKINDIIKSYENEIGDYMFLSGAKI